MNEYLPILAIETSGETCGVAVMKSEKISAELSITQKHVHSEKLLPMIKDLLKTVELRISDLGSIAVSIGPGSFTGLRIGLAAAKGIAFGNSIPITPVPTFEALALQISQFIPDQSEFVIANRVNVNELYFAGFISESKSYKITRELKLIERKHLADEIIGNEMVFGNAEPANLISKISEPNAEFVAKWSYIFGKDLVTSNFDYLEPNYLKKFIAKVKK